jgi:hypothetical protein
MKLLLPCVVLMLLLAGFAYAEGDNPPPDGDNPPVVTGMATTLEQFQAKIPVQAKEPKGAVHLWLEAIYIYTTKDKELGSQCITLMCKDKSWKTSTGYFIASLNEKPYIWRSYAKGSSPENNYQMDPNKFEVTITRLTTQPYPDKPEGQYAKFFVTSSGADTPRPMALERNIRGEYKASEFSSLCVGVRAPKAVTDQQADF